MIIKQLFILLVVICISCSCASKQDIIILESHIVALKQKNNQLNKDLDNFVLSQKNSRKNFKSQYAGQNATLDILRDEIKILTGRVEEVEHFYKNKTKVFENIDSDTDIALNNLKKKADLNTKRLGTIESYLNIETDKTVSNIKVSNKPETESSQLTESEYYKLAKSLFDAGDFDNAREKFKLLIERYPDSDHADNAQFWIGEAYFREKWYEKAILEYQKVIEKYPNGNKICSALLKQGIAFYTIEDMINARLILRELINKKPKSKEAEIARKKLKEFKYNR